MRPTQRLYHSHIYRLIERDRETKIPARNQNCPFIIYLVFLCKKKKDSRQDDSCLTEASPNTWGILEYFRRIYITGVLYGIICKRGFFYLSFFTQHCWKLCALVCDHSVLFFMWVKQVDFGPSNAYISSHRICFKDPIEWGEEEQHTFLEALVVVSLSGLTWSSLLLLSINASNTNVLSIEITGLTFLE